MGYKVRFNWDQDTSFPIYKDLIRNAIDSTSGNFSGGVEGGTTANISLDLNIEDDFSYEIKSNFENYGEALGGLSSFLSSILGLMEKLNSLSSIGGESSSTSQWMKYQVHKETEPFRMSFKFNLHTKDDPFVDVYAPACILSSMSILSFVKDLEGKTHFYTPGVNGTAMKSLDPKSRGATGTEEKAVKSDIEKNKDALRARATKTSKLLKEFTIWAPRVNSETSFSPASSSVGSDGIPILIIKDCFIESAKPTWSKDRTASGIPLWCELEVTVQSVFSAHDAMFSYLGKNSLSIGGSILDVTKTVATNVFR